jgi:hypothetical protein
MESLAYRFHNVATRLADFSSVAQPVAIALALSRAVVVGDDQPGPPRAVVNYGSRLW